MRILLFVGFLILSVLVPVGLTQAQDYVQQGQTTFNAN